MHTVDTYQAILDTTQTGIFLFAPVYDDAGEVADFRFTLANQMLADYVGQPASVVTGSLGSTFYPAYKENGLFESYRHTFLTGEPLRFEIHYLQEGIDCWLDIKTQKIEGQLLVTFTDHTELRRLQLQLEQSVADLKESNASLEQFAHVASHDMQEPLRKIRTFGALLQQRNSGVLDGESTAILQRMIGATARMQSLIEDLLTFSKISAAGHAFVCVPLQAIVHNILVDVEAAVVEKKAKLHIGKLPEVAGDALKLHQLFLNLITNALKFVRPGVQPEVDISAQLLTGAASGFSLPAAAAAQAFHLIEVKDNGAGFEPEYAERIFGMFQRLHGKSEFPGTGIGLSIAQRVAAAHGGYIQAIGRPGEGATFRVLLPA